MKKLYIGSAYDPIEVTAEDEQTIREIYKENNVNLPANALVTLNSRKLKTEELDQPISTLNIENDDTITITEKYNSAI